MRKLTTSLTLVLAAVAWTFTPATATPAVPLPALERSSSTTVAPVGHYVGIPIAAIQAATSSPASSPGESWSIRRPDRGQSRAARAVELARAVPARWLAFARCVLDRESGGTLERPQSGVGALNASGAAGRWQFMPDWRWGLPFQVRDRLVQFGMSVHRAAQVRRYLWKLRYIHKWPGVYQDIGWNEAIERGGDWHWGKRGSRCEQYR